MYCTHIHKCNSLHLYLHAITVNTVETDLLWAQTVALCLDVKKRLRHTDVRLFKTFHIDCSQPCKMRLSPLSANPCAGLVLRVVCHRFRWRHHRRDAGCVVFPGHFQFCAAPVWGKTTTFSLALTKNPPKTYNLHLMWLKSCGRSSLVNHRFGITIWWSFAAEITNETSMCRPADMTVYFPNSRISFCGAKWLGRIVGWLGGADGDEVWSCESLASRWYVVFFSLSQATHQRFPMTPPGQTILFWYVVFLFFFFLFFFFDTCSQGI